MIDPQGNRFITVTIRSNRFNLSFQSKPRIFWLNNIGDDFAYYDDGLIFAVQIWRIGFSVEPIF